MLFTQLITEINLFYTNYLEIKKYSENCGKQEKLVLSSAIVGNEEKWATGYNGVMFRAISVWHRVDSFEWTVSSGGSVIYQHRSKGSNEHQAQRFHSLISSGAGYTFLSILNSTNFKNELEIKLSATFWDKTKSTCTVSNVRFSGNYTVYLLKWLKVCFQLQLVLMVFKTVFNKVSYVSLE